MKKYGCFLYYRLRKCGLSTFEAIKFLANYFYIKSETISYCGLKDEDGVTDQFIAIPYRDGNHEHEETRSFCIGENRWLSLLRYGWFEQPLEIGELSGNSFSIRVRNVPDFIASGLKMGDRVRRVSFINYYDKQRFGVPGGKKYALNW